MQDAAFFNRILYWFINSSPTPMGSGGLLSRFNAVDNGPARTNAQYVFGQRDERIG